jgi:hypothetical protein
VRFHSRIANVGDASTGETVGVAYFVNGTYVGYGIGPSMEPGEVRSDFAMVDTWNAVEGTLTVRAMVDDIGRYQESIENNNILSATLVIEAPLATGSTPEGECPCRFDVDNFCSYDARTDGCAMTWPGGYCDPDGDGERADGDWTQGYFAYQSACTP